MDDTPRTDRLNDLDRTVAVVITYALDLDHAVDVLLAEFGFDATFGALAAIDDNPRAHQAMWLALAEQVADHNLQVPRQDAASQQIDLRRTT